MSVLEPSIPNSKAIAQCQSTISSKLNFYFSSFTGASNARFDGMVVTNMTFSTCVVYNIWFLGTFNFLDAIAHCRSAISVRVEFHFTGASNARFNGMG